MCSGTRLGTGGDEFYDRAVATSPGVDCGPAR